MRLFNPWTLIVKFSKMIYLFSAVVALVGLNGFAEDSGRPFGEDPDTWTPRDLPSEEVVQDSKDSQ